MNPSGLALLPAALPMDCLFGEPQNRIHPVCLKGHWPPVSPPYSGAPPTRGCSRSERRGNPAASPHTADRQSSMARGRNHGTFTDTFFSPYVLVWHGVVFTLFEAFNIGMIGIGLALLQG